jgi:hypothetical protein
LRFVLPIVKSSSALGLVLGLWRPRLGRITAGALIAYFVAAIGFHRRAHDSVAKTAPATAMLVWSAAAWRAFPASP